MFWIILTVLLHLIVVGSIVVPACYWPETIGDAREPPDPRAGTAATPPWWQSDCG